MKLHDIALCGLGVMGKSLAQNMASHGFRVLGWNRPEDFPQSFGDKARKADITLTDRLSDVRDLLTRPRRVFLMVPAGKAVDSLLNDLMPYLEPGDIVMDGGNSFYRDTMRREKELSARGILFMGVGVSGGEEGALRGPSMMPGGSEEAWRQAAPILTAAAAKAADGSPCCDLVGPDGAGHFVKAVHNGIEYIDMQLISEVWWMLHAAGYAEDEAADRFGEWNAGRAESYLMGITEQILRRKDKETGLPLVRMVLDTAGQKGTGMWTSREALEMGIPAPSAAEAVFARCLSAEKELRVKLSGILAGPEASLEASKELEDDLRDAHLAGRILAYDQGFALIREASAAHAWGVRPDKVALLWRNGCIIRARFLDEIAEALSESEMLCASKTFSELLRELMPGLRRTVARAAMAGIPIPCLSSSLAYYDGLRSECLPANLLQAQRDCFGAHTYRRIDREGIFHSTWTED